MLLEELEEANREAARAVTAFLEGDHKVTRLLMAARTGIASCRLANSRFLTENADIATRVTGLVEELEKSPPG